MGWNHHHFQQCDCDDNSQHHQVLQVYIVLKFDIVIKVILWLREVLLKMLMLTFTAGLGSDKVKYSRTSSSCLHNLEEAKWEQQFTSKTFVP